MCIQSFVRFGENQARLILSISFLSHEWFDPIRFLNKISYSLSFIFTFIKRMKNLLQLSNILEQILLICQNMFILTNLLPLLGKLVWLRFVIKFLILVVI